MSLRRVDYTMNPFETKPCEAYKIEEDGSETLIGSYESRVKCAKSLRIKRQAVCRSIDNNGKTRHKDGYWIKIKNKN